MCDKKCIVCSSLLHEDDQFVSCEVCAARAHHPLCVKRNLAKFTCQYCSDIKPAHVLMCLKKHMEEFEGLKERIYSFETAQTFIANAVKRISSTFDVLNEGVESLSAASSIITSNCGEILDEAKKSSDINADSCKKINRVDSGISTLLTAFDNDTTVPPAVLGPSLEKILGAVEIVQNSVNKLTTDSATIKMKIDMQKNANSSASSSTNISYSSPLQLSNRFDILSKEDPVIKSAAKSPEEYNVNEGWRRIGNKRVWKPDWTYFEDRIQIENIPQGGHRNKLQRPPFMCTTSSPSKHHCTTRHPTQKNHKQIKKSTRQHSHVSDIIANVSRKTAMTSPVTSKPAVQPPNYRSFVKGSPLLPTRDSHLPIPSTSYTTHTESDESQTVILDQSTTMSSATHPQPASCSSTRPEPSIFMDPLISPNVKATMISANESGRYVLSRLNNHSVYNTIRTYVAYLHDKPPSVSCDSLTALTAKVRIGSEGIPTDVDSLKKILVEFNSRHDFSPADTQADLDSFKKKCESDRINHLQRSDENFKKFFGLVKSKSKKNF